jgi:tetratricopeptide (TPR) repeat protein
MGPSFRVFSGNIALRHMSILSNQLIPRSAPAVLLYLALGAVAAFAAVDHLVSRFHANVQSRGRRLYAQGVADLNGGNLEAAVEDFRAALTCDPANPQYQLSLGRALRDTGHLDEAESYLLALWQRTPEDGTINLALGRVAARRGSVDDAIRYYHNAMYGIWSSDPDGSRRKARLELIDFLLQKDSLAQAQSEILALAALLPPDPTLHFEAAQLFSRAQDYADALYQYEQVLRLDRANIAAMAAAGDTAYHLGHYRTAQRYLQEAARLNPQDSHSRQLLPQANLILDSDPFVRRISDAERNRRIVAAFRGAGQRLTACAQSKGLNLSASPDMDPVLSGLEARWSDMKKQLPRLHSSIEADLPDTIMDLVFQIEQQTASDCGSPQGMDQALLLISRDREAADQ